MSLTQELSLRKGFEVVEHEAILNIYFTASQMKKAADEFFKQFGLTDVQFNVMMLLHYQGEPDGGLAQSQISDMMLVNRANVTSLIDRMENSGLLRRTATNKDRRCNIVKLTTKGKKLFAQVEPLYAERVIRTMAPLKKNQQQQLIQMLEKVRARISSNGFIKGK